MAAKDQQLNSGFNFTANHATVMVAIVGAIAAFFGNLYAAHESLPVAQQDLQAKLIFKAVEGSNLKERTNNLHFLIDAGFITDPDNKIRNLNESKYPSKSNASFDCAKDPDAPAQLICKTEELAILDKVMAKQYHKLMGPLQGKDKQDLVAEQLEWIAERDSCLQLGAPAENCMAAKYEFRIAQLFVRLNGKQIVSAPPVVTAAGHNP